MAVSDFTVRVSGTVAYTDGSSGSFEASAIWRTNLGGIVATHNNSFSRENFAQLWNNSQMGVQQVLDILAPSGPGQVSVTSVDTVTSKTVDSFVMEISGLAAYDDNTKAGFVAQWVNGAVNLSPDETLQTWADIAAGMGVDAPSARAFLEMVFQSLANISITT